MKPVSRISNQARREEDGECRREEKREEVEYIEGQNAAAPSSTLKLRTALGCTGRSNTGFSLYDRRFKLLLYRLKQTTLSSGLYFILQRSKYLSGSVGEESAARLSLGTNSYIEAADVGREPWPQRQPDNTGTIRSSRLWQWPVKKEAAVNTPLTW